MCETKRTSLKTQELSPFILRIEKQCFIYIGGYGAEMLNAKIIIGFIKKMILVIMLNRLFLYATT